MNKEIGTDSRQLDRKLFDLIHLLVALLFCHIRRSIPHIEFMSCTIEEEISIARSMI